MKKKHRLTQFVSNETGQYFLDLRILRGVGFALITTTLIGDGQDLVFGTYDPDYRRSRERPPAPPWCSHCGYKLQIYAHHRRWCGACVNNDFYPVDSPRAVMK